MKADTLPKCLLLALALFIASPAHARALSYLLDWSGASFANGATATGRITIDDSLIDNPGFNDNSPEIMTLLDAAPAPILPAYKPYVIDFKITVSGSGSGNGTWELGDFRNIIFGTDQPGLDLTMELVGQVTDNAPWGSEGCCGDFNIFTDTGGGVVMGSAGLNAAMPVAVPNAAPYGFRPFGIQTSSGDQLLLTSFRPDPAAIIQVIDGLLLDE